jgi:ABC-2 type transport system permease protein
MTTSSLSTFGGSVSSRVAVRHVRALVRQPWYVAVTLVQPVVWLLLFGSLFKRVVELPGFASGTSYIAYLTPGVAAMTVLFSSGWAGMTFIDDMERGVLDRMLVTPAPRFALVVGQLLHQAVSLLTQTCVIVGLAALTGARFPGGAGSLALLALGAVLLGASFAAYSDWLALTVRQRESLIGAVNFLVLPLSFLSTAFLPRATVPGWIRAISTWNPVDWAIVVGRQSLRESIDWGAVAPRLGGLALLTVGCAALAASGFRAYQRSV